MTDLLWFVVSILVQVIRVVSPDPYCPTEDSCVGYWEVTP
jgi:hypothetical protein